MTHAQLHPYLTTMVPVAAAAIGSASVILIAGALASRFLSSAHASLRHRLLLSTLATFALPLPALFAFLLWNREWLGSFFAAETKAPTSTGSSTISLAPGAVTERATFDWQCPTAAIVIVVSLIFLLVTVWRFAVARRRSLAIASAAPSHAAALLDELRQRSALAAPLPLFVTESVSAPVAVGVRDPFILVPAHAVTDLPEAGLRAVLAHEVAHVKRRDNLWSFLDTLIGSIFWFNPFVWIVRRELALDREQACDHAALDASEERSHFVDALLTLCRGTAREPMPGRSCINSSDISRRVDYIMRTDRISSSRGPSIIAFVLTLLCALASVTAMAMVTERPHLDTGSKPYKIHLAVENGGPGRTRLDLSITDAKSNALVLAPTLVIADGEDGTMRSEIDGTIFEADAIFDSLSSGLVRVRVLRDGGLLQEDEFSFRSNSVTYSGDDTERRISVTLRDADLRDVASTFGKLTGRTVIVEPGLEGRVTIEATDEPWLGVLSRILNQVHASARGAGNTIYVGRKEWLDNQKIDLRPASRSSAPASADGITPPAIVSRVEPMYTPEAKAARIAGMCIIAAEIDEQGNVTDARVLKGLPHGLGDAALTAVKQWKFSPALKDGVPVAISYNVVLNFSPGEE